jgi:hypothetical protein
MADLTAGQIPKVANVPNGGLGTISASSNTVTMGSDANGATIYTAGASGGRVIMLSGVTNDTVTVNVFVYILRGATVIPVGMVNIPLSSGNTNAARFPVDFLNGTNLPGLPIDNTGRQYIPMMPNDVLRATTLANLTGGRSCWITAFAQDFVAP